MLKRIFRSSSETFRTRSPERDRITDERLVLAIAATIDSGLRSAEYEHDGLKRRLEDVISIAAIVGGNEIEDVNSQSDPRAELLQKSDDEIRIGEARLRTLENNIEHFRSLKRDLRRRFPSINLDAAEPAPK
ncbi:hypothetical protein [Tardiphaga sp. 619_E2_N8_5]|jgi:hypothetical protein|uniref:hypothetical protein n=1 Tax=unclassified Tardiphaga TaxID=2631404 RepID=UPI003F25503C